MADDILHQLPSILTKSPLSLVGAFLFLVRDRFKEGAQLPWVWRENPTTSDIIIEVQYNPNTELADVRPGIYVDLNQISYGKVSTGNQDQYQPKILQTQLTHHISFAEADLAIDCISPARGESMQLADLIQTYLEASKYVIMRVFGFRDLSAIVMERTQPFTKQQDLHQTTIHFRVEYEVRWATMPAAVALQRLGVTLAEAGQPINTTLAHWYLKSISQ